MKNPFVAMAVMAAAMMEAFKENKYRDAGIPMPAPARGSRGPVGKRNPAGSKAIMRFYKAHHGTQAESLEEARTWYANVHKDREAAVIKREAERKALREARKQHPRIAHRLAA